MRRDPSPWSERLDAEFWKVHHIARRYQRLRGFQCELELVANDRVFTAHNDLAWRSLLSEREMVEIDLASWARGVFSSGGFLKLVQGPDLAGLARKADGVRNARSRRFREDAFTRLFPRAADESRWEPNQHEDMKLLCDHFVTATKPLVDSRDAHRAHKHEHLRVGSAAALDLDGVELQLRTATAILNDMSLLSRDATWAWSELEPLHGDSWARELVDLVLGGQIDWLLKEWQHEAYAFDGNGRSRGHLWQRREAFYERLRALNDDREKPFNARSLWVTGPSTSPVQF